MIDLENLKRLQDEATQGEWETFYYRLYDYNYKIVGPARIPINPTIPNSEIQADKDSKFIAAHSPIVMRELVERLESAEYLLRCFLDIDGDIDGDIDEKDHHYFVLVGSSKMHFKKYGGKE